MARRETIQEFTALVVREMEALFEAAAKLIPGTRACPSIVTCGIERDGVTVTMTARLLASQWYVSVELNKPDAELAEMLQSLYPKLCWARGARKVTVTKQSLKFRY